MPSLLEKALKGKLFDGSEQPVPAGTSFPTKPDQPGLAHHPVFRNKTPIPGVLRSLPVISHHPVIIHFECIGSGGLPVQVKFTIPHFKLVVLIHTNGPFVKRVVACVQRYGGIFFGTQIGPKLSLVQLL
jgi:hypothetical protein